MDRARDLAFRYRYALLALGVSAVVHAAAILGAAGWRPDSAAADEPVRYTADLVPPAQGAPAAAALPPRAPRPRSPRKPTEVLASLPSITPGGVSAADALPELAAPLPELAPPLAAAPEPAKPEMLAAALPNVPIPAPKAPEFPVGALPADLSIRYTLTSPFADGFAEYAWRRDGDRYDITGSAEATGFFTLFLEGRILQESRGRVTSSGLRPDRFVERKPQGPAESLTFDWEKRAVEFNRNGEVKSGGLADNTVDWLSMIFQLAHEPPRGAVLPMKVYTQRKLYEFELKVLGIETLELPLGTVKALHLRHEAKDANEQVDVWLGVDYHYLPVKMRYPVARNRFMVEQVATDIRSR